MGCLRPSGRPDFNDYVIKVITSGGPTPEYDIGVAKNVGVDMLLRLQPL